MECNDDDDDDSKESKEDDKDESHDEHEEREFEHMEKKGKRRHCEKMHAAKIVLFVMVPIVAIGTVIGITVWYVVMVALLPCPTAIVSEII